jgi:HEAT repeat protein
MTLIEAQERATRDQEAEAAVMELWSDDENVRRAAKEKLIELGPEATKPLIALLEELKNNPGPRYARGKENEAEEALQRYRKFPEGQKGAENSRYLVSLDVSGRLRNDVYELLGRLHAEDAVHLLVEIVEEQTIDNLIPGMTPVMRDRTGGGSTAD